MLSIQPAIDNQPADDSGMGLALAGGGPLGGIYEIGALRALDEALEGVDFNNLDIYVGVSSGSFVASILANQVTTAQMCRIFIKNYSVEHLFAPETFLKPALTEYFQRVTSVPELFMDSVEQYLKNPWDLSLMESLSSLSQAIPTGVFNNETIAHFLTHIFGLPGRTNDFRQLKHPLYVIAVNLDTSESVKFGAKGLDHIPISKAVQASAALPGLYPPVEIDGRYYVDGALRKTLHASAALKTGVTLLFCINPLVPFDANMAIRSGKAKHENLIDGGLPVVLSQTFRTLIHSRMQVGMSKYQDLYKNADIILCEPNRDDARMFFTNVFSYSNRRWIAEHAYQTTRHELFENRHELEPVLARHGISLREEVLADKHRHFGADLAPEDQLWNLNEVIHESHETLDELQNWLEINVSGKNKSTE